MSKKQKILIIAVSTGITALLHLLHSEVMGVIVDSASSCGIILLLFEDNKE